MANVLVTGGAGFMGRWVVKTLLAGEHKVWVLDNLSNGSEANLAEFRDQLQEFVIGNIEDRPTLAKLFDNDLDLCLHLAATINVQDSIDRPEVCFTNNLVGTFNVLEECRRTKTKVLFMSSALIYATAKPGQTITEEHPVQEMCPYSASKISGEKLTLSYFHSYDLPAVVLRPFSIYGPFQRSDTEGGVMSIFIKRTLAGEPLLIFGSGEQSRDFFYVEDCARFVVQAAFAKEAEGQIINAGSGEEVKVIDLAKAIATSEDEIQFVEHPHPHAEVMTMRADSAKANRLLGWELQTRLEEGIARTRAWLEEKQG